MEPEIPPLRDHVSVDPRRLSMIRIWTGQQNRQITNRRCLLHSDDFSLVVQRVFQVDTRVILGPGYGRIPWTFTETVSSVLVCALVL